jgi:hypothetical protein
LNIENEGNLSISTWIQVDENTLSSAQDVVLSKNSSNYTNVFGAYTLWLNLNGLAQIQVVLQVFQEVSVGMMGIL